MPADGVGGWFLVLCIGFTKQARAGDWPTAALQDVCGAATSGRVTLRESFEQLVSIGNPSISLAELGLGHLNNSRSTPSPMWDVVEQACGGEEEPEKVTLRSAATSVADAEVQKAYELAKETVEETASHILGLQASVSQARQDLGQSRAEIEKWTELSIDRFSVEVAEVASGLGLLETMLASLYHALLKWVGTVVGALESGVVHRSCRRFSRALRDHCKSDQLQSLAEVRVLFGRMLRSASTRLTALTTRGEIVINQLVDVNQHATEFSTQIENHIHDKDGWLAAKIKDLRTKAYAGCLAVVWFPPAWAVCQATAAGVLEGKKVPELKRALQDTKARLRKVHESFEKVAAEAKELTTLEFQRIKGMHAANADLDKLGAIHCDEICLNWWKLVLPEEMKRLSASLQLKLKTLEGEKAEARASAAAGRVVCENPRHPTSVEGICHGRARLGKGSKWSTSKNVDGKFTCTTGFFGGDPWPGMAKECICEAV